MADKKAKVAVAQKSVKHQTNILFKEGSGYKFTEKDDKFFVEDDMRNHHEFTKGEFNDRFKVKEFEPELQGYGAVNTFPQ